MCDIGKITYAAVLPGDRYGKSRLNWILKISNTANIADITQSQIRDTRHRRMQEVSSLCTYSGPLPAEYCIEQLYSP